MIKVLFSGLPVLAALLISLPANADTTSTTTIVPVDTVSIPSVTPPLTVPPTLRIKRGEACPPVPAASDPWPAAAVSLVGGCQTTSEQQHHYARKMMLPLMTTEAEYQARIASGYYVPFEGPYLQLLAKRPYALPSTVAFVNAMAKEYQATGCGRLIVRGALRLTTERPPNGSIHSVHPAGMAVDIRTNHIPATCAEWLRNYLREKEALGEVDGTHELKPEHLHVVVPVKTPIPPFIQDETPTTSVGAQ